jgi:hypothetical protein
MENLLRAQKTLEKLEGVFVQDLAVTSEAIEGAHTQFLSGIRPITSPEARYILTVGCLTIRSFLWDSHDNPTHTSLAHGNSVWAGHIRPSHAVAH